MSDSNPKALEALKQFVNTDAQRGYIDAVIEHGSNRKAADALGINHSLIARTLAGARRLAAVAPRGTDGFVTREVTTHYDGDGAETGSTLREVPAAWAEPGGIDAGPARDGHSGFLVKGVSTLFDAEGNQRAQWVKTRVDDVAREEALREAFQGLSDTLPRQKRIKVPSAGDANLLNLFTLTDCHVGMMAWHREGGANWDLEIAEETLVAAFAQMIARAPKAQTAIVNQLGDFLHFDGLEAVTPTNRHVLDADGRFRKVSRVAVRVLRRVINMALETHERVHVICAEGNHDLASSGWLTIALDGIYEDNPRVTIDDSPLPFYRYRHGKTLLGFHHGHTKDRASLPMLFAQQFRAEWGETAHTYIHTGHRHHVDEKDSMGVRLVQHATLAARDAYAARHGYHAARLAVAITYHAEFGEWGRVTVTPEMLRLDAA